MAAYDYELEILTWNGGSLKFTGQEYLRLQWLHLSLAELSLIMSKKNLNKESYCVTVADKLKTLALLNFTVYSLSAFKQNSGYTIDNINLNVTLTHNQELGNRQTAPSRGNGRNAETCLRYIRRHALFHNIYRFISPSRLSLPETWKNNTVSCILWDLDAPELSWNSRVSDCDSSEMTWPIFVFFLSIFGRFENRW